MVVRWFYKIFSFLLLTSIFSLSFSARAENPWDFPTPKAEQTQVDPSLGNPEEIEAMQALAQERYIKARELSEAILKKNPNSVPALYTLGYALHNAEGNLPRALYFQKQARHQIEQKSGGTPTSELDLRWYGLILTELADLTQELDLREEQLEILRKLDTIGDPLPADQIFPLIKLGRYDEAKKMIELSIQHPKPDQRERAMNGQCWLDCEQGNRQGCYDSCQKACQTFSESQVICANAADGATVVFRFDLSERGYLATTRLANNYYGTPWKDIAMLYLRQARIPEVTAALKKGQRQRMSRPAYTDQQDQASVDSAITHLLIVLGYGQEAERLARRTYQAPDRGGAISSSTEQLDLIGSFLYVAALRTRLEEIAEQRSTESFLKRWLPDSETLSLQSQLWSVRQHVVVLLSRKELFLEHLRPYLHGANGILEPWLVGNLIEVLGSGVFLQGIFEARQKELQTNAPLNVQADAYFDAYEAEAYFKKGHFEKSFLLAKQAFEKLPLAEVLLKSRLAALLGEMLGRQKDAASREQYFSQALENFPAVFRLLELQIPIRIDAGPSALGHEVARALRLSPRFTEDARGFLIRITEENSKLSLCFYRQLESLHGCSVVDVSQSLHQTLKVAIKEFHQMLMSPKLNLSQSDLNSLEGSPSSARARQQQDDNLKKVTGE